MEHLINGIRNAIHSKNYYAALFIALTLPDICGKIEYADLNSGTRYKKWISKYLAEFKANVYGYEVQPYRELNPSDLYALRCAALHEGKTDIGGQRAKKIVDGFILITHEENYIHMNWCNNQQQFDVMHFCLDMAQCVENWSIGKDTGIGLNIIEGAEIHI